MINLLRRFRIDFHEVEVIITNQPASRETVKEFREILHGLVDKRSLENDKVSRALVLLVLYSLLNVGASDRMKKT